MWFVLAQTPLGLDTIIQLASAGGFGVLAWYLVVKVMPEKDKEHREERKLDQERWRDERAELLGYISHRDARWLDYIEKRDTEFENLAKEWTSVMIRVEAMLLRDKKHDDQHKP